MKLSTTPNNPIHAGAHTPPTQHQNQVTTPETLMLFDGRLTPAEAEEMILNTLSNAINFQKIKNWSSQMRYGLNDAHALQQITSLQQEKEKFLNLLNEATHLNQHLHLTGEFRITFTSDKFTNDSRQ